MASRYAYDFDDNDPDVPAAWALRWMRGQRRVLELGAAGGHVTAKLRAQGCQVVAVEYDAAALPDLAQVAETVVQADLDTLSASALLPYAPFDGIIATDVLEHLRDPERVVTLLASLLRDDGMLVVSLPNVAHGDVRLALLSGRFQQTASGLLDRTHLRFFTRESAQELLERHGFAVGEVVRTRRPVGSTEQARYCADRYLDLRARIATEPEADTYQFVLRAARAGSLLAQAIGDGRRQRERAERAEAEVVGCQEQLTQLRSREQALHRQVVELEGVIDVLRRSWSVRTSGAVVRAIRRVVGP